MAFAELWLEMRERDNAFRVALLVPVGFALPDGYSLVEVQPDLPKELYVSRWYPSISEAIQAMRHAARFWSNRSLQFLFFREIRPMTAVTDT